MNPLCDHSDSQHYLFIKPLKESLVISDIEVALINPRGASTLMIYYRSLFQSTPSIGLLQETPIEQCCGLRRIYCSMRPANKNCRI